MRSIPFCKPLEASQWKLQLLKIYIAVTKHFNLQDDNFLQTSRGNDDAKGGHRLSTLPFAQIKDNV